MRNYFYLSLLFFLAISGLLSSCSSPATKRQKAIIRSNAISGTSQPKEKETLRLAPTTRYPETETGGASYPKFRTQYIEPSEEENLQKLTALLVKYNPETEEFTIDPTKATSITSSNGTQIYFQKLAFKDDTGNIIKDPVTIQLKVCDNPLAFLANNLVTETSDGRLLESGGMLHIEAFLNEQKLVLDSEKEAIVLFPKFGSNIPEMQSFRGVNDGDLVKWELSNFSEELKQTGTNTESVSKKNQNLHLRIYKFTAGLNEEKVDWIMKDTDESLLDWLESQDIRGSALESFLSIPERMIQTKVQVTKKGKLILTQLNSNDHGDLIYELQKLFDDAPELDIESMSNYFDQSELVVSFIGQTGESKDQIRSRVKRKYGRFKEELISDFSSLELTNYILEVNQLGWHNCDKFIQMKNPAEILVKNSFDLSPIKVLLIFDKQNSQAEGKRTNNDWEFLKIPLGSHIRILAFAFKGDQPFMVNHKIKITNKEQILPPLEFKPFSYSELELALKR